MKKKLTCALFLGALLFACVGAGCNNLSKIEENQKDGYMVSVSYDANGGSFLNRPGITVMDMFKPSNYTKDANGIVHIKLTEPTERQAVGTDDITLTLQNHFFAGWYQNREVKTVDGKPVDEAGSELALVEGEYYYANTLDLETPTKATPAYNYSGYWDFENDTIEYKEGDGIVEMTLYAGWVPYYEFNYYYQVDGEWTKMDMVTTFDYKTTNTLETEADQDTVYLPQWDNGAMNYKTKYANGLEYTFPSVAGMTFEKAYTDKACTEEIVGSFEHKGMLNPASGVSKELVVANLVQDIYVTYTKGEQYHIETAQQLIDNANVNGYYEIAGDLNFTGLAWPSTFSGGEFNGKMYGKDGAAITFSNITATYATDKKYGGLFGKIGKDAKIENVTFDNVTVDLQDTGRRNHEASYGLFAGEIVTGATLSVSINGTLKIGAIGKADDLAFHLVANGDRTGVTAGEIGLIIYGNELIDDQYEYTVNHETVKVETDGTITFEFYPSSELLNEENYKIQ